MQPIYGIIRLKLFLSLQIITVTFEIHLQLWSNSFNPNSHGVGHIGHAPLWRQIAKQNFNYKNFEKLSIPRKLSCEYFFSEGVPLKKSIYVYFLFFLGKRQVIQRVGPIGQPQWELDSMFFYT